MTKEQILAEARSRTPLVDFEKGDGGYWFVTLDGQPVGDAKCYKRESIAIVNWLEAGGLEAIRRAFGWQ